MSNIIDCRLAKLSNQHYGVVLPQRGLVLHAMLTACGRQSVSTADYDWHGLRRGSAEFVVFQYTLCGVGCLEYAGKSYELSAGMAMLVKVPHDHRYYFPSGAVPWEFIYVCMAGREVIRICQEIMRRVGPVLQLSAAAGTAAVDILAAAAAGKLTSAETASDLAYHLTMAVLASTRLDTAESCALPSAVRRGRDYCRRHFREPIGIDQIVAAAGCSRYHFSRQFKQFLQLTPWQYVTDLRLREAARLLRETNLTLKEIAALCGFPDGNYLCKVFHHVFGLTPATFRRTGMY